MDNYEHVTAVYIPKTEFDPDSIPSALIELPRWVVWSLVKTNKQKQEDKPTKRPVRLSSNNPHHPSIDIAKWSTPDRQYSFEHCLKIYNENPGLIAGLGFIPNPDDGVVVIDYDNYLPLVSDDPRTKYVEQATQNTFVELSQSGKGLHIFLFGELSNRHNDSAGSGVELYPGKKQSFIAMTGVSYNDAPSVLNTDQAFIDNHVKEFFSKSNKSNGEKAKTNNYDGYKIPDSIPNGNRNNELTKLCGYLFWSLSDPQKVAAEMYKYNQQLCETPLELEELQAIITSIGNRHNNQFQSLVENIYHVKSTNTWYDFSDMTDMCANALDITHIKNFPGKKDTRPVITKWLAKQPGFNQAADFTWAPVSYSHTQRTVSMENRLYINTWKGFNVEPKFGNVKPWLNHLEHVVPEKDYREALLWWIAYSVQHPDKKINWQPIILGISGAGKDALFRPIAKIFGSAYKTIGNKDIKGDYDDGLYQTKILHISEANGLSGKAVEYYKRITATEADDMFILNIKSKGKVIQRNICNVVVITNNLDAMKFDYTERRAFVLRSPNVMTEEMVTAYFDEWFDIGGSEHLFEYLLNYDLSSFKPSTRPFRTIHFDAMYDITRSDDEINIEAVVERFDAISPELVKHAAGIDSRYSSSHIKTWLECNGWVRWDAGITSRRIHKKINGKDLTKSRSWYVRYDGPYYNSDPKSMFEECERVEALILNNKKF